jgi:hypothetical protein
VHRAEIRALKGDGWAQPWWPPSLPRETNLTPVSCLAHAGGRGSRRATISRGRTSMRRLISGAIAAGALAGCLAVTAGPAVGEERVCRGTIGATTVDNLRVPDGATCALIRTYVKGTVKVESGAKLVARRVRVVGNVQAENHRSVALATSTVGGSVQLKQGGGATVKANRITGDLQSFENRGAQTFRGNRINGNLQCKQNQPAPTGGGNIVGGNKEDQCARL